MIRIAVVVAVEVGVEVGVVVTGVSGRHRGVGWRRRRRNVWWSSSCPWPGCLGRGRGTALVHPVQVRHHRLLLD